MADDVRRFVAALAESSDEALQRLLVARGISPAIAWRDPFDAAEALLDHDAVLTALGALNRGEAAELLTLIGGQTPSHATRDRLQSLGLLDAAGAPYDVVTALARSLPRPGSVPEPATASNSPAAAERAFRTIGMIADLLVAGQTHPISLIGSGAIGAVERKRLVESGLIDDPDATDPLLWTMIAADLMRVQGRELLITPGALAWLDLPTLERWRALHAAFERTRPSGLAPDDSLLSVPEWHGAYPWNAQWSDSAIEWRTRAVLLGLVDESSGDPTPWALGSDDALQRHLPAEVDRVYLQNDLSVIAPGPLAPALDLRLRRSASRESHAQASTYRFTRESVARAFSRGETAESLLEFLSGLSLTGVPQPLTYLIADAASRHGAIRILTDPQTGRTRVQTATDSLRETLAIDQTLRPLGLARDGHDLTSRVSRDTVAIAIADAKYPVAMAAADGTLEPVRLGRVATEAEQSTADFSELIARLRPADPADLERAWFVRELEAAVRERAVLEVTVSMGTDTRAFVLEAAGFGGGRLRGRDRSSDVERTLPVSHIINVRRVESGVE